MMLQGRTLPCGGGPPHPLAVAAVAPIQAATFAGHPVSFPAARPTPDAHLMHNRPSPAPHLMQEPKRKSRAPYSPTAGLARPAGSFQAEAGSSSACQEEEEGSVQEEEKEVVLHCTSIHGRAAASSEPPPSHPTAPVVAGLSIPLPRHGRGQLAGSPHKLEGCPDHPRPLVWPTFQHHKRQRQAQQHTELVCEDAAVVGPAPREPVAERPSCSRAGGWRKGLH